MAQCDVKAVGNSLGLFIDMTPNAGNLVERHSSLKTVQIFDSRVIIKLATEWKRVPNAELSVELTLADREKFRYSVTQLRVDDSTIWLDVNEDVPKIATQPR